MAYPDFPFQNQKKSYVSQIDVLNYLNAYADHFDLKSHIKFQHYVTRVRPLENDNWEVIVRDLVNDKYETYEFDAIMICNGHYHTPSLPNLAGRKLFKGKQMHSHDYRHAEPFKGEESNEIASIEMNHHILIKVLKIF